MIKAHEELLHYLFGHADQPLAKWCATRFEASPRFAQFVAAQRSKIRKKIRQAAEAEALRDLACELAVAFVLAEERSFEVSYEPLAAQGRSPDFGVFYKGHTTFYVEVTRTRAAPSLEPVALEARLAALLCSKLRQLPTGAPSILVIVVDASSVRGADLDAVLRLLWQRADAKDDAFFAFRGLEGTKVFQKQIVSLSAVLLVPSGQGEPAVFWQQRHPRHPLPASVVKLIGHWELAAVLVAAQQP